VSDRRIVVTGATAGIGLAIARHLLGQGHRVFICGRDAKRLEAALAELRAAAASRVGGAVCDVRDLASVKTMMAAAERHLDGLDVLINNAGIAFIRDFEEISPAMWADIVETNLTGVFNCCHAALPALKAASRQGGVADIVNLGSRSGRYSVKGGVGYNTTKFGLQGLTEAMFLDLNRFGIRVGLVAPGTVATGFGGTQPADWHLKPEDVAEAVAAMIAARPGASLNWVELRPARPPA
jgi:NAD(P)-dependent dehydrogenase (short-subunit alcohol dehydrogenase family)